MKKFRLTTLTIIALFTLAVGVARAESGIVVHIGEDFVAGGKTFPAGTYKVYQASPETGQTLALRGEKTVAFLLPSFRGGAVPGQLNVKLKRVGDVYYLSEVTTDLRVYTFPAPRVLTRTAQAKDHEPNVAASGSR